METRKFESELIISVDVETGGPVPGVHPLLSVGAVAYAEREDGWFVERGTFSRNIADGFDADISSGAFDESTSRWWSTQEHAWLEVCKDRVSAHRAAFDFEQWTWEQARLCGKHKVVFLADPVVFDYPFVQWLFRSTKVDNPFALFETLDMKSFIAGALNQPYDASRSSKLPDRFTSKLPPHTHIALDDARHQGAMFARVAKEAGWPYRNECVQELRDKVVALQEQLDKRDLT